MNYWYFRLLGMSILFVLMILKRRYKAYLLDDDPLPRSCKVMWMLIICIYTLINQ